MLKKIALPLGVLFTLSSSVVVSSSRLPLTAVETIQEIEYELKDYRIAEMDRLKKIAIAEREREKKEIEEVERIRVEEENRQKEAERVVTYNPYDILEPSNLTEEEIYQMLEGSALQSLSRGYYYVEQETGVNLLFLIALNSEESARGESSLAISHNNLGGVKSRDGGWAYFEDWYDSLSYIADLLKTEYLNPDGSYYNGSSIWDINTRYCLLPDGVTTDYDWSENINTIAYEYLEKVN